MAAKGGGVMQKFHVLLVDDEENILKSLCRLLMDTEDLIVMTASSGEEGLEVLKENPGIALIVSDQRMPGMSGAEFLEKSRQIIPEAVRMVLTGYADINATMDAINKGGAARYITKPWDDGMLVQTIRDGVRQFSLQQENRRLTAIVEQQNEKLAEWNTGLKARIMEQTKVIRKQNEDLAERNSQIQRSFKGTIEAFSRLTELRGSTQRNHARNVTELALNCAREQGVTDKELETIRIAALLHDIGEIGIPEAVLSKKLRQMTQNEQRIYLQHAVRGQTTIDTVEELRDAGNIVRHHHEHYNGKGYPDGLQGDAIPLGARIIALADFVDRELGDQRGEEAIDGVLDRATLQLGILFDSKLLPSIRRHAHFLYFYLENRLKNGLESELKPDQLEDGLEVSRDLFSGTGLMLVAKGTVLDRHKIETIRRYYLLDPPERGIFAIKGRNK
jgi:response regulator RpfG family c-di-GMP phosphodiesterase